MNRIFATPTVPAEWADVRETHPAVARAIHAIASESRTPEAIWEAPTAFERDYIALAVEEYVRHGDFPFEREGYQWGQAAVMIVDPSGHDDDDDDDGEDAMLEIEFLFSSHDDGYRARDWFEGGQATIDRAEAADSPEEADAILRAAYRGPDVDGVGVRWVIQPAGWQGT